MYCCLFILHSLIDWLLNNVFCYKQTILFDILRRKWNSSSKSYNKIQQCVLTNVLNVECWMYWCTYKYYLLCVDVSNFLLSIVTFWRLSWLRVCVLLVSAGMLRKVFRGRELPNFIVNLYVVLFVNKSNKKLKCVFFSLPNKFSQNFFGDGTTNNWKLIFPTW